MDGECKICWYITVTYVGILPKDIVVYSGIFKYQNMVYSSIKI